jgi:hypothetical protein
VVVSAINKPSLAVHEEARVLHADPIYVVATWNRHVLVVWRREISVPGVAHWSRSMAELKQQNPGRRINVLVYVEPACQFGASPVTFAACVDALKRFEDVVAATAIVYDREGFWNAAMRGRVTAIHNESKTELPYSMHQTLAQAIEWLRENGADDLQGHPQALSDAVEALRRA